MVRGWDSSSHEALLMAFIDVVKPNKALLADVTERMNATGWSYSYDAINQHIQKLRKNRDTTAINTAASSNGSHTGTPAKATPKKQATPRKKATPKKAKTMKDLSFDDESGLDFDALVKKEEPVSDHGETTEKRPAKRIKKETFASTLGDGNFAES